MLEHPFGLPFTLHLLFQGTIVLALTSAGRVLAVRPGAATQDASGVGLVRLFLASVYFWAGIGKLRGDWLDGRTLALFLADGGFRGWAGRTVLSSPSLRSASAIGVVAIELALPFLLLIRRTQTLGLVLALALHSVIELAARPDLLGWEMVALLLALWPVSSAHGVSSQGSEAAGQPMKP
jgi:hypothetical protein